MNPHDIHSISDTTCATPETQAQISSSQPHREPQPGRQYPAVQPPTSHTNTLASLILCMTAPLYSVRPCCGPSCLTEGIIPMKTPTSKFAKTLVTFLAVRKSMTIIEDNGNSDSKGNLDDDGPRKMRFKCCALVRGSRCGWRAVEDTSRKVDTKSEENSREVELLEVTLPYLSLQALFVVNTQTLVRLSGAKVDIPSIADAGTPNRRNQSISLGRVRGHEDARPKGELAGL